MLSTDLNEYVSVTTEDYEHCIDVLEHDFSLSDVAGTIRFHHLKCDGNGRPMVKALAEMLYEYIIYYCIASRNRPEALTAKQAARLTNEARKLFRHPDLKEGQEDTTGEAGEALLYFLTEAVLQAPQIVAKMELKTNHSDEVKGSDGIHAKWNNEEKIVDFYFGESKLYKDPYSAISSAIKSISQFHNVAMYKHEFAIATKHFKYANDEIKSQLKDLIRGGEISTGARINHACLIGFDWDSYKSVSPSEMKKDIKKLLLKDGANITSNLNKKLADFEHKYLRFDIFFLPFPSVAEFRKAFNMALD